MAWIIDGPANIHFCLWHCSGKYRIIGLKNCLMIPWSNDWLHLLKLKWLTWLIWTKSTFSSWCWPIFWFLRKLKNKLSLWWHTLSLMVSILVCKWVFDAVTLYFGHRSLLQSSNAYIVVCDIWKLRKSREMKISVLKKDRSLFNLHWNRILIRCINDIISQCSHSNHCLPL